MLPPSIVVKLAEDVRVCRAQLDEAEATADKLRLDYNGYLTLLTFAESQVEPAPIEPVSSPDLMRLARAEEVAMDEQARGPAWCFCGFPGVGGIGIAHGITACTSGNPDPMPAAPAPGSLAAFRRGFFAPHIPANTGSDATA